MKTKIGDPNHEFLRRPCRKCSKYFRPMSKFNHVCNKCYDNSYSWLKRKRIKRKKNSSK